MTVITTQELRIQYAQFVNEFETFITAQQFQQLLFSRGIAAISEMTAIMVTADMAIGAKAETKELATA